MTSLLDNPYDIFPVYSLIQVPLIMYSSNIDICIAGALAAVIVELAVYPFDTLKTRVQSPEYEKLYKDPRTGALLRNVLFRGLYQGIWSVVLATVPSSAGFFTTYEAVKRNLSSPQNPDEGSNNKRQLKHSIPTPISHALASSSAEMVACLMTTPAEVVKQNAQVVDNTGSKTSPPAQGQPCGKASVEESKRSSATNNPPGGSATLKVMARFRSKPWKLWSGYFALVGRNLPFTGLQFPIFEFVRGRVAERRQKQRQSRESSTDGNGDRRWGAVLERAGLTGFSAAVSATIASLVTSPLDVVKTRVMLSAGDGSVTAGGRELGGQSGRKRPGMFAVGREVFYGEGVRGLFRGAAIRSGWTVVSLSIYLSIYEGSRFYLENRRKEKNGVVDMEAR